MTTTTTHTAGPWRTGREDMQSYDGHTGEPFSSIYADDERGEFHLGQRLPLTVAIVLGTAIGRREEKANARLIAAAPDLLAALKFIVDHIEDPDLVGVAGTAIDKAEGG